LRLFKISPSAFCAASSTAWVLVCAGCGMSDCLSGDGASAGLPAILAQASARNAVGGRLTTGADRSRDSLAVATWAEMRSSKRPFSSVSVSTR